MRSIALLAVLAVPCSALAADYTHPIAQPHASRLQYVTVTFVGKTMEHRAVVADGVAYRLHFNQSLHLQLPVGAVVTEYSDQNSRIAGLPVLAVSAQDADRTVVVR